MRGENFDPVNVSVSGYDTSTVLFALIQISEAAISRADEMPMLTGELESDRIRSPRTIGYRAPIMRTDAPARARARAAGRDLQGKNNKISGPRAREKEREK